MPLIDCSCQGLNPDCDRCAGRGYYDSNDLLEHSNTTFVRLKAQRVPLKGWVKKKKTKKPTMKKLPYNIRKKIK